MHKKLEMTIKKGGYVEKNIKKLKKYQKIGWYIKK